MQPGPELPLFVSQEGYFLIEWAGVAIRFFSVFGSGGFDGGHAIIVQPMEWMAISRNVYPCREIARAKRLTGKKESGRFREMANTIKLRIMEVTRI